MVLTPAVAAPPSNIPPADKDVVPPGLTRVTVIHEIDRTRTIVDHGPGIVPPPRQQTSFACTDATQDTCDTNSFTGKKWFNLPVNYFVNLEGSGDDGNFLAAVIAGSQVWEDGANSSFEQEFIDVTDLQASGAQQRRMDGFNVVDWGNTKKFGFSVIAVTVFWYFTSTGEIVEADFRYNQDFSWSSNGGPTVEINPATNFGDPASMDVQNIGAHEFGHFHAALFDITDSSASALTMYAFGALGETQKRDLGVGDQLSIETAYPVTITPPPPNDPPTANDDFDSTSEDIAVTTAVLINDDDPDGNTVFLDSFDAVSANGGSITRDDNDTPGDTSDDKLTYTPDTNFNGVDTYDYTISDGSLTDFATVTITVDSVNDPPIANAGPDQTVPDSDKNGVEMVTLDGSDSSDDGTLSYVWTEGGTEIGLGVKPIIQFSVGSHIVTLTVTDNDDVPDSDDVTITVSEPSEGVFVKSISPNPIDRCKCTIPMTITGSGFSPNVNISITGGDGPAPVVSNIVFIGVVNGDENVTFDATLKNGGPPRQSTWTVTVTNTSDGTSYSISLRINR